MFNRKILLLIAGLYLIWLGAVFYAQVRGTPLFLSSWIGIDQSSLLIIQYLVNHFDITDSLPSFLVALAVPLIFVALGGPAAPTVAFTVFSLLFLETLQALSIRLSLLQRFGNYGGTFDWNDIAATAIGGSLAYSSLVSMGRIANRNARRRWLPPVTILAASFSSLATSGPDRPYFCTDQWEAARKLEFKIDEPRPLKNAGKVYIYEQFLIVNEIGEGLHIIDNSDPSQPIPVKFIQIPGNTDLAVRSNLIFANSLTDLLIIDLAAASENKVVSRVANVFSDGYKICINSSRRQPISGERNNTNGENGNAP